MNTPISTKKHAVIKLTKKILNLEESATVYEADVKTLKELFIQLLQIENLSPSQIAKRFNIEYSDFGTFLRKCLGIELKSVQAAVSNYNRQVGREITDEKKIYKKECEFQFNPYDYSNIPGYDKLLKYGMYHPQKNPNPLSMTRDHLMSKEYGFRNQVPSEFIRHPANCQFITMKENSKKNEKSLLTFDQLMDRINTSEYKFNQVSLAYHKLPKSIEHRRKLSDASKKYFNITNGKVNRKHPKNQPIPKGFRRGLTKNGAGDRS